MTKRLVRQMLAAQTLAALTVSLCLLIDNVMINRFLGEKAIAAYELSNPVLLVIGAIGSMLSAGIQVACSKSLGEGSREETNSGYSSAVVVAACVSLVFMAAVLLLRGIIARALGAGRAGELFEHTRGYLAGFVVGAPASMGALILVPFLQMAGRSGLLVAAVLGMTVSDVAFDLLNVYVFHGGMFGMGLASALSYYVAVGVGLVYFLSKKCVFRFSVKLVRTQKIVELFTGGVPSAFGMGASILLIFVLNRLLIKTGGTGAVAAYAVASAIMNASNCISTGTGGVALTLSGVLYHEEDRTGLGKLLHVLIRYAVEISLAAMTLLLVFAPAAVSVFLPAAGATKDTAILAVRLMALGLVPCCVNNALRGFYQGTERILLIEALSLLEGAILPIVAALALSGVLGTTGVWLSFAVGEALALAGVALYVHRASGAQPKGNARFMLLREDFGVSPEEMMEFDIHTLGDAMQAAEKAGQFCLRHGQDMQFVNRISLCVEEMTANVVTHGFADKGGNHLSVLLQHKEERWVLRFRDDCRAFDPVNYVPREGGPEALGIRLVLGMADEVRYTYSLNMNNLTILLLEKHGAPDSA